MDIGKYIGIDYYGEYATNELNNILSKFYNLDYGKFSPDDNIHSLLDDHDASTTIKFINMFQNINKFGAKKIYLFNYSLAGNIISMLMYKYAHDKIYVYKVMDHLFKLNMNIEKICIDEKCKTKHGMDIFNDNMPYVNRSNHNIVGYMINKFNIIQCVRKIINNYDVVLFDIAGDLQFIKSILLISKSRHKNLPKFVITHKILYYYLLDKNEINNI